MSHIIHSIWIFYPRGITEIFVLRNLAKNPSEQNGKKAYEKMVSIYIIHQVCQIIHPVPLTIETRHKSTLLVNEIS
jgi:hypothetical protein